MDAGERSTWFFGRSVKPDATSRFEIGAISEVFTGVLLAQAVFENRLRLQTPIRAAIPGDMPFADASFGAVTLLDLATHRSGLPELPPNLMPASTDDPYAEYSELDLMALLANQRRSTAPARPGYSPLEYGLLGQMLARTYAGTYAKVLKEKVLTPLGLQDTTLEDDGALLTGHALGQPVPHWHFGVLAGSAGLRSTLDDLLDFLQVNLRPAESPLRASLLLARLPRTGSGSLQAGLGWHIIEVVADGQTWPLVWRASSTAGFSAFIGFRTDRQQALVLLGNSEVDLSALGLAWLKQEDPPAAPAPVLAIAAPADLSAYAGLYRTADGLELIVRDTDSGLTSQLHGFPADELHAVADDTFVARSDSLVLTFRRESGKVAGVVLDRLGVNVLAKRLSERAPHIERAPSPVAPETLHEFTGDYRLDANTLLRVGVRDDALTMQLSGRAVLPLVAYAKDRFTDAAGTCTLVFRRDASGLAAGLTLGLGGVDREAARVRWIVPILVTESR
jgi:serine-type D-Ala-D-Ala carboxypeptidase/endopeptidase